jgi:hypothetical protein
VVSVWGLIAACDVNEAEGEPDLELDIHDERNIEFWGREYLESRLFRRTVLEQSLNFQENGYARLRLNEYGVLQNGSDAGWELLPEFAPLVRPFIPDQGFGIPFEPVPLLAADWTRADLYTLGQWAFERYPVQLDGASELLLRQNEDLTWWGMTRDDEGQVGGLVEVQLPSGGTALGMTCATCHGDVVDGSAVDGRAVAGLDRGRLMADAAVGGGPKNFCVQRRNSSEKTSTRISANIRRIVSWDGIRPSRPGTCSISQSRSWPAHWVMASASSLPHSTPTTMTARTSPRR